MSIISLSVLLLISELFLVSGSHNPHFDVNCKPNYCKGENVPEDGFFDPNSNDLENAFSNFVMNIHPNLKGEVVLYNLERIDQLIDTKVMDSDVLETCVSINSAVLAKGLNETGVFSLFESFWSGIGVFNHVNFNELTQKCEMEKSEVKAEQEDKKKKKGRKCKNNNNATDNPVSHIKKIPFIKCPEYNLVRSTLECSICQLTMSLSVRILSAEQVSLLFANAPSVVLDNPEILKNIMDFSLLHEGTESLEKLTDLLKTNSLTENMIKTLPINSLFSIIKGRRFEITSTEERLLRTHRPGVEFEEPFSNDHRTFRLFADNKSISLDSSDLIIEAKNSEFALESVLAFCVRNEQEIGVLFEEISQISFDQNILQVVGDHSQRICNSMNALVRIFNERTKLIEAYEDNTPVLEFLISPLNDFMLGTGGTYGESSLWKSFQRTPVLLDAIPYDLDNLKTPRELLELWNKLTCELSDQFRYGRWARNFVKLLSIPIDGVVRDILLRNRCSLGRFDPGRYDWFLLPLSDLSREQKSFTDVKAKLEWTFLVKREARKILNEVDFGDEAVIEAIWGWQDAMTVLVAFPDVLTLKQVKSLMNSERGSAWLKANPSIIQRLPSYSDFTVNDMNRFKLDLDDLALSIATLPVKTAQEWLLQREYLVNSRIRALFRPNKIVHSNLEHSWQLITFESFRTSYCISLELNAIEMLKIRKNNNDHLNISEIMSLIARWMVHMETQFVWAWIISKFPRFSTGIMSDVEFLIFDTIQKLELQQLMEKLSLEVGKAEYSPEIIENINGLIRILKSRSISTSKFVSETKKFDSQLFDPVYSQGSDIYSIIKSDNDFLIKLIQDGPGSTKFKRVWSHRAKLLIITDIDMRTIVPFDGMEAADLGLIPLDDALLQWFLLNRIPIERLRIKSDLRKLQNLEPEEISSDIPYANWYNVLIKK